MVKLISVVIPTYNRQALTDRAVDSVLTGSPELVEILVVDDCGEEPYQCGFLNSSGVTVRIVRLNKNVGAGEARRAGVASAMGRYIAYLDSDDCYDANWIDYLVSLLAKTNPMELGLLISGRAEGAQTIASLARRALLHSPKFLQLTALRCITILFNPFYTPTLVVSRELCAFADDLRHCEDYYSTAMAIFQAQKMHLPEIVACHLGRAPNSAGGESASRAKMFRGEWQVRKMLLRSSQVPFLYRGCLPLGFLYQRVRAVLKRIASIMKN